MSVSFTSIEADFCQLRDYILNDLKRLCVLDQGGNYAAALLITTACEALGRLRYDSGKGSQFFKDHVIPKNWQPVALVIFNSLRNELAHSFATKAIIQIPDVGQIELGISWKDKPHFTYDLHAKMLHVNVQGLRESLQEAILNYEGELKVTGELRERFCHKRKRNMEVNVQQSDKLQWRELLGANSGSL